MRPTITPITTEADWLALRDKYITSTMSPSLFGMQMPSKPTAYEMWQNKHGNISNDTETNDFMRFGRVLEQGVAEFIAEKNPDWRIRPMKIFTHSDDGMGASFDRFISTPEYEKALLEIKTTTFKEYKQKFIEEESGYVEAPSYYEIQCQHQLESLYDETVNAICLAVAIIDTRQVKYLWRERDRDFGRKIRERIVWFNALTAPPPPDLEKDADLLARIHRANNKDKSYDGTENADFELACLAFLQENEKEKQAEAAKKRARSAMILAMGDCNTAWCSSARVSNKGRFSVTAINQEAVA